MIYWEGHNPQDVFDMGLLNKAELRIHNIFQNLPTFPPWQYDLEHYSYEDQDMYGRFYAEDWANIKQIRGLISDRESSEQNKANVPKGVHQQR